MGFYLPMIEVAVLVAGMALLAALLPNIVARWPRRTRRSAGHRVRAEGEAAPAAPPRARFAFWKGRR